MLSYVPAGAAWVYLGDHSASTGSRCAWDICTRLFAMTLFISMSGVKTGRVLESAECESMVAGREEAECARCGIIRRLVYTSATARVLLSTDQGPRIVL
jgi:hypothetical protein